MSKERKGRRHWPPMVSATNTGQACTFLAATMGGLGMSLLGAIIGSTAKVTETRRSDGTIERTVAADLWVTPAMGARLVNALVQEAEQRAVLIAAQDRVALLERELRLEASRRAMLEDKR